MNTMKTMNTEPKKPSELDHDPNTALYISVSTSSSFISRFQLAV